MNIQDLWPEARVEYAVNCRMYRTPERVQSRPTVQMLRERLRTLAEIGIYHALQVPALLKGSGDA